MHPLIKVGVDGSIPKMEGAQDHLDGGPKILVMALGSSLIEKHINLINVQFLSYPSSKKSKREEASNCLQLFPSNRPTANTQTQPPSCFFGSRTFLP